MKAVVFDEELKLDKNYEKPIPQKGEALIKVKLAGICNTDFEIHTPGQYLKNSGKKMGNKIKSTLSQIR